MSRKLCLISGRWLGVFALLWLVCSTVRADEPPSAEGVTTLPRIQARVLQVQVNAEAPAQPRVVAPRVHIRRAQPSGHWLGLECALLGDALRSHLKPPQGQGLLVVGVVHESPAEKKLQPHDVLLSAGGAPLRDIGDLAQAVENSKDAELELELIRGGETITVGVQPGERPAGLVGPWGRQGRFQVIRPGTILSADNWNVFPSPTVPAFPGGLSVVITKNGDDPATISVQRGDQKWKVTEDELDKLPADVRADVQRLRENGGLDREGASQIITIPPMNAPLMPDLRHIIPPGFLRGDAERGMQEMKRRLERLEREFDQRFGPQEDESDQDTSDSKPRKRRETEAEE